LDERVAQAIRSNCDLYGAIFCHRGIPFEGSDAI
jgi:hypothetical protein